MSWSVLTNTQAFSKPFVTAYKWRSQVLADGQMKSFSKQSMKFTVAFHDNFSFQEIHLFVIVKGYHFKNFFNVANSNINSTFKLD